MQVTLLQHTFSWSSGIGLHTRHLHHSGVSSAGGSGSSGSALAMFLAKSRLPLPIERRLTRILSFVTGSRVAKNSVISSWASCISCWNLASPSAAWRGANVLHVRQFDLHLACSCIFLCCKHEGRDTWCWPRDTCKRLFLSSWRNALYNHRKIVPKINSNQKDTRSSFRKQNCVWGEMKWSEKFSIVVSHK